MQKLYTILLELPPNPYSSDTGPINCPANDGINYSLDFYKDTTLVLHAVDHPTGCSSIELNSNDIRAGSSYFDGQLEQALGLSEQEFGGF